MSSDGISFADITTADKILHELYPTARQISFVEHGYDNLVGLVDEIYAVRFPRNKDAYARSKYEKQVLNNIQGLSSVQIPKVLNEHDNPPYFVTTYLQGEHLSAQQVNEFSPELQKEFGEKVARFAYELHSKLSLEEARHLRTELQLDEAVEEPWDIYFKKMLLHTTLPTPEQDRLAKQFYKQWTRLEAPGPLVVVHDDLHTQNMLFEDNRLTGVLDFGDTNIGTAEQELRQLYRINETVMRTAADMYSRLSGRPLNMQAIITWAITQELAAYSERLINHAINHPAYIRACNNLNKWLPTGSWGEGLVTSENSEALQ